MVAPCPRRTVREVVLFDFLGGWAVRHARAPLLLPFKLILSGVLQTLILGNPSFRRLLLRPCCTFRTWNLISCMSITFVDLNINLIIGVKAISVND